MHGILRPSAHAVPGSPPNLPVASAQAPAGVARRRRQTAAGSATDAFPDPCRTFIGIIWEEEAGAVLFVSRRHARVNRRQDGWPGAPEPGSRCAWPSSHGEAASGAQGPCFFACGSATLLVLCARRPRPTGVHRARNGAAGGGRSRARDRRRRAAGIP